MKSSIPLLTIGIPTFNRATYLKKAIQFVLVQNYRNIELIISDNCSSDDTEKICLKYSSEDKRIQYIRQKRNIGMKSNFMVVLRKAKGKYFIWYGDDDIISQKNYFSVLIAEMEKHPSVTMGIPTLALFDDKKTIKRRQPYILPLSRTVNSFTLLKEYLLCPFLKHPEFFCAVFQAVHKTSALKHSILEDSFIMKYGIDSHMIRKMILSGVAVYAKELLFLKRDTGYYITSGEVLQNLDLNKEILRRMFIYLSFPFSFFSDFFSLLPYLIKKNFSFFQKAQIICIAFVKIFVEMYYFLGKIIRAGVDIGIGILRKI